MRFVKVLAKTGRTERPATQHIIIGCNCTITAWQLVAKQLQHGNNLIT